MCARTHHDIGHGAGDRRVASSFLRVGVVEEVLVELQAFHHAATGFRLEAREVLRAEGSVAGPVLNYHTHARTHPSKIKGEV